MKMVELTFFHARDQSWSFDEVLARNRANWIAEREIGINHCRDRDWQTLLLNW